MGHDTKIRVLSAKSRFAHILTRVLNYFLLSRDRNMFALISGHLFAQTAVEYSKSLPPALLHLFSYEVFSLFFVLVC